MQHYRKSGICLLCYTVCRCVVFGHFDDHFSKTKSSKSHAFFLCTDCTCRTTNVASCRFSNDDFCYVSSKGRVMGTSDKKKVKIVGLSLECLLFLCCVCVLLSDFHLNVKLHEPKIQQQEVEATKTRNRMLSIKLSASLSRPSHSLGMCLCRKCW